MKEDGEVERRNVQRESWDADTSQWGMDLADRISRLSLSLSLFSLLSSAQTEGKGKSKRRPLEKMTIGLKLRKEKPDAFSFLFSFLNANHFFPQLRVPELWASVAYRMKGLKALPVVVNAGRGGDYDNK